jgi:hypothetical protein
LPLIAPLIAHARLRFMPRGTRAWSELQSRLVKSGHRVPANELPVPGYTVFAWRSGYELTRSERWTRVLLPSGVASVSLQCGIENLANRLYRGLFETVPQPGREFRFAVDLNFGSTAR